MPYQTTYEKLNAVQAEMRPWVFQLVSAQIQKALHYEDRVALHAFESLCNPAILYFLSDVQQFERVESLLADSAHKEEYLNAIHDAFVSVHGEQWNQEG
jgi:hypothetical protein